MTNAVAALRESPERKDQSVVAFGSFLLDRNQRVLLRDGQIVRLTPKAFDLLDLLVSRAGEVVSKQELIDALWPDTFVSEANLAKLVFVVRKEVGEPFIETVPKRGYLFLGEMRLTGPHAILPALPEPPVRSRIPRRWWIAGAAIGLALVAVFLLTSKAATPAQTHIVVMPFTAIEDTDHSLAEGMSEFAGARLSTVRGLVVLTPPSSASSDPRAVARGLGAGLMLTGTVQRIGDRIRVTYGVMSVDDRVQLAAASLTATSSDIFELQERVAGDVAALLELRLSLDRSNDPLLVTPERQQTYIRAIGLLAKTAERSRAEEAIALLRPLEQGRSALVLAALGRAYLMRYVVTLDEKDLALADQYAARAAQLDARHARVRALLGAIAKTRGDHTSAVTHLKAALALEPDANDVLLDLASVYQSMGSIAEARSTYEYLLRIHPECAVCVNAFGVFQSRSGRPDLAVPLHHRAISLDPNTANALSNLGYCHYLLGDYEKAAKYFGDATKQQPGDSMLWGNLGDALRSIPSRRAEANAAFDEAITRSRESLRVNANDAPSRAMLAEYLAKRGDVASARRELATVLKTNSADAEVLFSAAVVYTIAGDRAVAVDYLHRAADAGLAPSMFANDPQFRALRGDRRFRELVR